ncbi:MAG: hypothetical protein WCJ49_03105 [Deltaproteobacteria bacterium]
MKHEFDPNDQNQEAGEEQLSIIIKQAGNDARLRKQEAMFRHFEKIRAVIIEAKSRQEWTLIK